MISFKIGFTALYVIYGFHNTMDELILAEIWKPMIADFSCLYTKFEFILF